MTRAPQEPLPRGKSQRFTRSITGWFGGGLVFIMILACMLSLPFTFGRSIPTGGASDDTGRLTWPRRFERTDLEAALLPPSWAPKADDERQQLEILTESRGSKSIYLFGTDTLGRDMLTRCLAGGGISLGVGIAAAIISVFIGTLYGTISGYLGGRIDSLMMRIVDVLYGLPYILLVVLLTVAVEGFVDNLGYELSPVANQFVNLLTLLVAIGGVSWLTLARVIRGQVLSLKQQPFMEACRAIGVSRRRQFLRHLLPNLMGPIIVYATLTVPSAILSESFLSFLGIGVREPLPSWGNLAASGLNELNIVRSRWWLLFWPCFLVGLTLLSMNFMGEALREAFDPKRRSAEF